MRGRDSTSIFFFYYIANRTAVHKSSHADASTVSSNVIHTIFYTCYDTQPHVRTLRLRPPRSRSARHAQVALLTTHCNVTADFLLQCGEQRQTFQQEQTESPLRSGMFLLICLVSCRSDFLFFQIPEIVSGASITQTLRNTVRIHERENKTTCSRVRKY